MKPNGDKSEIKDSKIADKIHDLETIIQQKDNEIITHLETITRLNIKLEQLERVNDRLMNAYNRINAQNKTLQEVLQTRIEDNEVLKRDNDALKNDNEILKKNNAALKKDNEALKKDNEVFQKELEKLNKEIHLLNKK